MSNTVDHVIEVSRRLLELRERLAQLDGQRADIEAQIAQCLSEISTAAAQAPVTAQAPPTAILDAGHLLPDRVLSLLNRYPDRSFGPGDIADELGINRVVGQSNIRVALARLAKTGQAVRVSYGRYSAAPRV